MISNRIFVDYLSQGVENMTDFPSCLYRNVSERDMDLLFMEAFVTFIEWVKTIVGTPAEEDVSSMVQIAFLSESL